MLKKNVLSGHILLLLFLALPFEPLASTTSSNNQNLNLAVIQNEAVTSREIKGKFAKLQFKNKGPLLSELVPRLSQAAESVVRQKAKELANIITKAGAACEPAIINFLVGLGIRGDIARSIWAIIDLVLGNVVMSFFP